MAEQSSQLVQKLWNYCNILRDDGLSYGDYVEQLTFLLFLKMADEQSKPPFNKPSPIPKRVDWQNHFRVLAKNVAQLVLGHAGDGFDFADGAGNSESSCDQSVRT
jgi:hypothetical protein